MKAERPLVALDEALSRHPALIKLAELAEQIAGIKLMAILPDKQGWKQVRIGEPTKTPQFCRMIQGTHAGVRHCQTNHLLMMAAAGATGMDVHSCHAGPHALVVPLSQALPDGSALISTCMFTSRSRAKAWKAARARAVELGLDPQQLRAAFDALPVLPPQKHKQVQTILAVAAALVAEIKNGLAAEARLAVRQTENGATAQVRAVLEHEIHRQASGPSAGTPDRRPWPPLIRAVVNLIECKPAIQYSAVEIAAAARITPNHFSALFHHWTGQRFLEFLNARRLVAAQALLSNLSLSIGEVAQRAGFEDANYFARRFKLATGSTPRDWRNAQPPATGPARKTRR
jgi:AraC-like DNA-binding protein